MRVADYMFPQVRKLMDRAALERLGQELESAKRETLYRACLSVKNTHQNST